MKLILRSALKDNEGNIHQFVTNKGDNPPFDNRNFLCDYEGEWMEEYYYKSITCPSCLEKLKEYPIHSLQIKIGMLRAGNYAYSVDDSYVVRKITSIYDDCLYTQIDNASETNKKEETINPIDIDDEWLLDFGFESNDRFFTKGYFQINKVDDVYRVNIDYMGGQVRYLKHVHSLQNIYESIHNEQLIKR